MSTRTLYREVPGLSAEQKIELAYKLLENIEEDPDYERLVIEEVERRYKEYKEGRAELLSGEEVIAGIRAKLESMERAPEEPLVARPFEDMINEALQLEDWERLDLAYDLFRHLQDDGFQIDWEREEVVGRSREPLPAINGKS